jgi:hypothetical protein
MIPMLQHRSLGVEYVEVTDEPHHVEQFKNEYARVYMASIAPGTCTLYHRHQITTLYVVMAGGLCRSEEPGNQPQRTRVGRAVPLPTKLSWALRRRFSRPLPLPTGTVLMQYHSDTPLTHRLHASTRNPGVIQMLGIELLTDAPRDQSQPAHRLGLTVEHEDRQATTYRIRLKPGQSTNRLEPGAPSILALVSGSAHLQSTSAGTVARPLAPGTVQWLNANENFTLTSPAANLHALLITLNVVAANP